MKIILFCLLSVLCQAQHFLPQPEVVLPKKGEFTFNAETTFFAENKTGEDALSPLLHKINQLSGVSIPKVQAKRENQIQVTVDYSLPQEAYTLDISSDKILIKASGYSGFFYAVQTLIQAVPVDRSTRLVQIPALWIKDAPRFAYRGVMLDVARHFYSVEYIKRLLDVISAFKLNTFHWHLTDDQGWRIEIKKYPKLTEIGSIRKRTLLGHTEEAGYEEKPYGGFYTQDQIREVVKYAASKNITVIPEIEMPGHAKAALAAYPELGCTGGPYEVWTGWGVEENIFCPTEQTFQFLEGVLEEVVDLFPSAYIHIGGDEAPKVTWKQSAYCQDLIKREGLKDENELQSYFIKRISTFLVSKGRRIIGWDEIMEGGTPECATVMSWRGTEHGYKAAKEGHKVIMSPTSHFYLDYYQGPKEMEPLANGSLLPLEKVYSFDLEEAENILGVQGNLWTEYIRTEAQVEYMLFPRILAVAELGWSKKKTGYSDFALRVYERLKQWPDLRASSSYLNVKFKVVQEDGLKLALIPSVPLGTIKYKSPGELWGGAKTYEGPIPLKGEQEIEAALFMGEERSKIYRTKYVPSLVTGLTYSYGQTPRREVYKGLLTDGQRGDIKNFDEWVGFEGKDANIYLELKDVQKVKKLVLGVLVEEGSWIKMPALVNVYGSKDGQKYESLGSTTPISKEGAGEVLVKLKRKKVKYIKVEAKNAGPWPVGHAFEGLPTWVFLDEISLE
ncbi:beta-N-acetylhexosaminidase [Leadbetterella byssophila]|uniref:beta-N-acetylhexosaminidase n=1 Tax=Leadbetterella byssophila TaxID=316068 RepID=UPI0039A37FED